MHMAKSIILTSNTLHESPFICSTVEDGVKKDFVPRATLGIILNQQNLELL